MLKKAGAAILLLAAVWVLPRLSHPGVDIGKLEPAEAVQIIAGEDGIRIVTDGGAWGEGQTLEQAVIHLKSGAPAEVFLETADKLVITGPFDDWETVYRLFRPACRACIAREELDLQEAVGYLRIHPPEQTLGMLRAGAECLRVLEIKEGRGQLVPK